jgi:hypothetical protein
MSDAKVSSIGRSKKKCPVTSCNAMVVHLPRHLKNVHKWKQERAKTAVQLFILRKPYKLQASRHAEKQKPDYHQRRQCPVDNCSAVVSRLSTHLQNFHQISRTSSLYKTLLLVAKKRTRKQEEIAGQHDESISSNGYCDSVSNDEQGDFVHSEDDHESRIALSESAATREAEDNASDNEITDSAMPTDFLQFLLWIAVSRRRSKCNKSARQHEFQVGVIFAAVDQSGSVSFLWNKSLLELFLNVYTKEKNFLPGIIKSCLSSIRHWYSYTLAEESDRLTAAEKAEIQQMDYRVFALAKFVSQRHRNP